MPSSTTHPVRAALIVGALGVVFGDLGTSPIYTVQTVFDPHDPHPISPTRENVFGVVSLIFWSIMVIVTVTYVLLAMRADNDGEGGILALMTLLKRWIDEIPRRMFAVLAALGVLGAALFLGDSIITPAISVLSAVEGVKVVDPDLREWVVPLTAVIVFVLFLAQRFGSGAVGRFFGPIMVVWFTVIAAMGIGGIAVDPEILHALSPTYALGFMVHHFHIAFFALAAVVLAVTGAEALYADMGHFGRRPISVAWIAIVAPALVLCYLGQGALVLSDEKNVRAPFFLLAPGWAQIPLIVLTTAATVIAAQAVISGAFSVAAQAAQLGYMPRLRVVHTSDRAYGQIYVPWLNWLLMSSVITLVFAFRTSSALAYAYGMAVTGTITITTILFFVVARHRWKLSYWVLAPLAIALLVVDALFVAANATKVLHGAWLPMVLAIAAFTVMVTWRRGRELVAGRRAALEGPLHDFLVELEDDPVDVVEGTAIFLNRDPDSAPLAFRANVEHNHVRHAHVLIATVIVATVPRVDPATRVELRKLDTTAPGMAGATITFGYAEVPDVPAALVGLGDQLPGYDLAGATYFLSTVELRVSDEPGMAAWRKRVFLASSHVAADASDHFRLPRERVVVLGSRIPV
ncbi:KUP/HAK/KT family potassium transporter [Gordonia sp. X0973]|uniref:potassium transporter Kup n=1 Tax=Gordonia sp. X0973 TaxID=2742602 RepID=UPI000F526936|nr:KUP/HAK/KT family potassium transporter [Gordonia sp. X0973]QKT08982.1 KUP/HAK/KT family potassium transporter [Gordonia sp. X0973]